jgi:hypothetical protein
MPSPILSTLKSREGRWAFLERKRKAELKRMGTKDVPILFWTEVPQQGADEEDTQSYTCMFPSALPLAQRPTTLVERTYALQRSKNSKAAAQSCIAAGGWTCRSCSLQEIAITS